MAASTRFGQLLEKSGDNFITLHFRFAPQRENL
jgi:hypothetical protein